MPVDEGPHRMQSRPVLGPPPVASAGRGSGSEPSPQSGGAVSYSSTYHDLTRRQHTG